MAMEVGVVTIEYLDRPSEPVSEFLSDLQMDALSGLEEPEDGEEAWGGGWGSDSLLEFSRSYLERCSIEWADLRRIDPAARAALSRWIATLPWKDDLIMLHLGR